MAICLRGRGTGKVRTSMKRVLLLLLLALDVPLGASGCVGSGPGSGDARPRPTVVTSTTVLADLIRNVVGDRAEVVSLVPAGSNPQGYEPAPTDVVTLSRATVVFVNGLHYESFMTKLLENAGPSLRVVTLSAGLRTLDSDIDHGDHRHLFPNPYLYLDVRHATSYVENIRDTMVAVDEKNADTYRASAQTYLTQLEELDRWILAEIGRIPESRRRLMKDHGSFPYYADRYGLLALAASYEGTQEVAPSASQYVTLIEEVRRYEIRVLFGEEGYNPKLLEQLARDTGTRFIPGLRAATLGTTDEANSYIAMMRANTCLIVESLQ